MEKYKDLKNQIEKYKDLKNQIEKINKKIKPLEEQRDELEEKLVIVRETLEEVIKSELKNKEFIDKCNEFNPTNIFVDLEASDDRYRYGEDDGTLHIYQGKIHACFISDQDCSSKEWNEEALPILKAFGLSLKDIK